MKPEFFSLVRSPWFWLAVAFVAAVPTWLPPYYLGIGVLTLIYIALALAWHIVGGLGGQISLAHSLFLGIGALLSSALFLKLGVNMWVGAALAAAFAAVMGAAIAWVDFRFKLGHLSFALITLAFAEIGELVALGWDFLGGASGLYLPADKGVLSAFQFGGAKGYFWLMLVLAVVCFLANVAILNSPLGYYLRAIRDNENAAQAVGIDMLRNKALAMAISAALTALVGTAYARYSSFVDPYLFASPAVVIDVVLIATIGGLGTPYGPLAAATLLVPFGEIIRGKLGGVAPGLHYFIYGALIILVIRTMPRGVVPTLQSLLTRRRAKRRAAAPAAPRVTA